MESDMAELGSWHQGKVTKIGKYQLDDTDGEAVLGWQIFKQFPMLLTADCTTGGQGLFGKLTSKLKH